ncbi:histidine kinase [Streptomyces vinaceus]|uniref:sensor histidine kinase n=1 Tax=Streptomyces vinaceus TaxID=1960 RepID=UPI0035E03849
MNDHRQPAVPDAPDGPEANIGDRLLTALVLSLLAFHLLSGGAVGLDFRDQPTWPPLLLVCAAAAVVTRRRHPLWILAAGAVCWTLLGIPWVIALALYNLALRPSSSRRHAASLYAVGLGALASRFFLPGRLGFPVLNTAFWTIACGALPLAIGLWLAARRTLLDNLREQLAQAETNRTVEIAAARTEERSRIAAEMHDVVAHQVSLMVLHAGALEVSATDPAAAEQASLIRQTGRTALQELRTVLGLLHAYPDAALAPQPTLERLEELLQSSRAIGVGVALCVTGTPRELPSIVERTAYRTVQEALTNIHKHAPGARATVRLDHTPTSLRVSIRNSRPVRPPAGHFPHGGHGLVGLGERIALLGGALTAGGHDDGGFLITATLPTISQEQPSQEHAA